MVHPLGYHTRRLPAAAAASAALVVVPIGAAAVTMVAAGHSLAEEPFGVFGVGDATIQVGSPLIAVALWVYWCAVAGRGRLPVKVVLPSLTWAALHLGFALWLGVGYFREPWNG